MKKVFVFFVVMILASSCACLIGQIPPQYIYVGENCEALLPDYTKRVTVTDNCAVESVTQFPAPGHVLNAQNQQVEVTITAEDVFGNKATMIFAVKAVDTIPPLIIPDEDFLDVDNSWAVVHNLYDQADKMVAELEEYGDMMFPWDEVGLSWPERPIAEYWLKNMVIYTPPAYAHVKQGHRIITFLSDEQLTPTVRENQ